jgi:preprotein translocase subunit SecF
MINLMSRFKRYIWFGISLAVIIPGIWALSVWGLLLGIDFVGGTLLEVKFSQPLQIERVRGVLTEFNLADSQIQPEENNAFLIRMKEITNETGTKILSKFNEQFGHTEKLRFETVGPTISSDLTKKAFLAVIVASIFIVLYIAFAFRKVPKPVTSWRFGICAIVALIHDVLVVCGTFAILGKLFKLEVDSMFVTALLTVIGFSVHDTIVVFDRIRENLITRRTESFEETANISVVQTLGRSLNTSLTVLFVLLALFLFGGKSISTFVLALLIGITTGTYSSIFNATPLLIIWQNFAEKRKQ